MKKQIILKLMSIIWVSTAFLTSCDPGIDLSETDRSLYIDQSLVIPIGNGKVTIEEVLKSFNFDTLSLDGDSIFYETDYETTYKVPSIDLTKNMVPFNKTYVSIVPSSQVIKSGQDLTSKLSGSNNSIHLGNDKKTVRVDSAKFSLVNMEIKINIKDLAIVPSDLIVTIEFPTMRKYNGTSWTSLPPFSVATDKINDFSQTMNLDISNFKMAIKGDSIPSIIKIKVGNRDITLNSTSKIEFVITTKKLSYEVAYGNFKINNMATRKLTIPLDMLSYLPAGLKFADPRAMISLESNVGSYMHFNIDFVKAFSNKNPLNPTYAYFNGSKSTTETLSIKPINPGDIVINYLKTINKDYGQTYQLFDTNVEFDSVQYQFNVVSDSSIKITDKSPMFVVPNMYMKAKAKIQIPLQFQKGSVIEIKDSIDNIEDALNNIKQGALVLNVTNGLPARVALLLSFRNAIGKSVINDTTYIIESPKLIESKGLVDRTIPFKSTQLTIPLTVAKLQKLKDAKKMLYKVSLLGLAKDAISGSDVEKMMYFTKLDDFKITLGVYVQADYSINLAK